MPDKISKSSFLVRRFFEMPVRIEFKEFLVEPPYLNYENS